MEAPVNVPFNRVDSVVFPKKKGDKKTLYAINKSFTKSSIIPHVVPERQETLSSMSRGQFVPKYVIAKRSFLEPCSLRTGLLSMGIAGAPALGPSSATWALVTWQMLISGLIQLITIRPEQLPCERHWFGAMQRH